MEATWDTSVDSGSEKIRLVKEGKKYKVPFDKLSDEDQEYVKGRRAELASRDATPSDFELFEETTPEAEVVEERRK